MFTTDLRSMFLATAVLLVAVVPVHAADDDGWDTDYERSGGLRTPRYEETRDACLRLAEASPLLSYRSFGLSPQGRELMLLIADREGRSTPEAVRAGDNAVLMIQCCIHAGESDGKDAGLMLLRDLAIRGEHAELLDHVTVLFMPMLNVDGHERFGPLNRANQNGPEEMGWRVTAQGYNLNRDYMKADAPEMRAWLELFDAWLPDFFIDSHVSDGADFQYTLMYALPIRGNMEQGLTAWTKWTFLPALSLPFQQEGDPLLPYGGFRKRHDPRSGMNLWLSGPRYSHGYAALRNRPGLLLETHMLKPYAQRVEGTYDVFLRTLEILNREHVALRRRIADADSSTAAGSFRAEPFPLTFERSTSDSVMTDFLGYDYEMVVSDITGGEYPVFHADRPRTFRIPVFQTFRPNVTTEVPEFYLVPPEWTDVVEVLEAHGVLIHRLPREATLTVSSVRFEEYGWDERPYEGRHVMHYDTTPIQESRTFPAGTCAIDLAQPAARVVLHALAPDGPDALVRWGFFDTVFERKEYIESYMLEPMLPRMLEEDPELALAWEQARRDNPALQDSYWASLLWFYRRTPWWDDSIGAYPVGWTDDRAAVEELISGRPRTSR